MDLRVTYDREADAAYICLQEIEQGQDARQLDAVHGKIILSFDSRDRLIGIEILSASTILPAGVCAQAEQLR